MQITRVAVVFFEVTEEEIIDKTKDRETRHH